MSAARKIEDHRSLTAAVSRALVSGGRVNVGNPGHPASFPFHGNQPRGGRYRQPAHNVGQATAAAAMVSPQNTPGLSPEERQLLARLLLKCKGGTGSIAQGLGIGACEQQPLPDIPVGPDGCAEGWVQCKQDLPVNALAVAVGGTVPIVVTPRRVATPYQWYYHGAANTFEVTSIRIDGVEYAGTDVGAVNMDRYNATVTDHSVSWAQFSSTTPAVISIRNFSATIADFRSTLSVAASRG